MKLGAAIKAKLPLISITTRDTVHLGDIIKHEQGPGAKAPVKWSPQFLGTKPFLGNNVYFWPCPVSVNVGVQWDSVYGQLVGANAVLIVANLPLVDASFFDCGEATVPKSLLRAKLEKLIPKKEVPAIVRALGGCTIKEALELVSLAHAQNNGKIDQDTIGSTRRGFFAASKGFTQIDTRQAFYVPSPDIEAWIEDDGGYFLTGQDLRLRARGLLFAGWPGTGKTSGAKHIAHTLGVPLFRLDIAGAKGKYVGESENALAAALARVDAEAPAVLLLDEVEKIFKIGETNDGNTTSGMLSQLLWWMQEHTSRILMVMTTNNSKAIPGELIRPGRIDRKIITKGLVDAEARVLARALLKTFPDLKTPFKESEVDYILKEAFKLAAIAGTEPKQVSHASLTQACYARVKRHVKGDFLLAELLGGK